MSSFGDYLKELRKKHGFKTQKQLADISGISQTTLSRIEAGLQKPQPDTLKILAQHLSPTTYGELMDRAGYFDGMPDNERDVITDFFTEHSDLDENIEKTLTRLAKNGEFSSEVVDCLKQEIGHVAEEAEFEIEYTPDGIRRMLNELDPDLDQKASILEALVRARKLHTRLYNDLAVHETQAPYWATPKDIRDFKRMLEDDAPVMFDGVPIEGEARQRVMDILTGLFWEAKEMNKKTYGKKAKSNASTEGEK